MSFIYLPTGKLHQKTEMKKLIKIFQLVTVTFQIILIARLVQIFMKELPTIQTYHQRCSKISFGN